LYFGDCVAVLNDFIYQTGGSICLILVKNTGGQFSGFSGFSEGRQIIVCSLAGQLRDLFGYVDSDYAGDLDRYISLTGYVFTVGSCAVSWKVVLQHLVTLSTTEAEYMAIAETCKELIWLKGLYAELCGVDSCINLFSDSQSAIYLTKNPMFHARTNHIEIKYHYVRDEIEKGKPKVCKISTQNNPVDMLTKPVPVALFELCSGLVGIIN
jgi:hypothetical protein